MFADIRGTRIFFDVDGMGVVFEGGRAVERRTAFLVHGGPGVDHMGMKATHRGLETRMQMIFFDQRGNGRSAPCDPALYTLGETVKDMEALRRHLGLGPVVSIGTSYGGMVAMAHAARYPEAVSHLVLSATASHKGLLSRAVEIVAERGTRAQVAMLEELTSGALDTQGKVKEYFRIMGPLYSRTFDEAAFSKAFGRSSFNVEIARAAFGPGGHTQTFDLRDELKNITAPTLILAGRHDFICAPEFSAEIHKLIKGSALKIFDSSSHNIAGDEPQSYLDAIAGFLVYNEDRSL